ncbi:hypothetical protein [Candidatus Protochlamydia phocaeensis]|uniref:hypothetical protein n=1 Tax=Candidatus Protochlamydia phocaeensis TaxID=1414722 RepID=UPI0008398754|nr:hypothetical protein [Candidatus Protochlamydia phocaeensis]
MNLEITFNAFKHGVVKAYGVAAEKAGQAAGKVSEWAGRVWTVLKSGAEKTLPYLKDVRIAAISLFAVNLLFIEIGDLVARGVNWMLPSRTETQLKFKAVVPALAGFATWVGGVAAFSAYAQIPATFAANAPAFAASLPSWVTAAVAIVGISLAAALVRQCFYHPAPHA